MIEALDVSKKFRIWEDRSLNIKETAINFLKGERRSFREVWALRNINFKIKEGESIGFVGENGSGKSTLLKLLCGIYAPDRGKVVIQGKISALLELGVGFHPDLTGEENIFLNGSMLGFNKKEMKKKFEEIVSFSEIGDFIYSPIRTYSSGMSMRLGFSVAMCVDPDILLIDEVLAVGDEAFQKKCLKRLEEFKSAGKTIIIVSHALDLIKNFCERVILLHEGQLITDGVAEKTIDKYHAILSTKERPPDLEGVVVKGTLYTDMVHEISMLEGEEEKEEKEEREEREEREGKEKRVEMEEVVSQKPRYKRYGTFEAEIVNIVLKNEKGQETFTFHSGDMLSICLKIQFHRDLKDPIVGFYIRQYDGDHSIDIYGTNSRWKNIELGSIKKGKGIEVKFLQRIPIPEGTYYIVVAIANSDGTRFYDWHENIKTFMIKNEDRLWTGIINLTSQILISRCS